MVQLIFGARDSPKIDGFYCCPVKVEVTIYDSILTQTPPSCLKCSKKMIRLIDCLGKVDRQTCCMYAKIAAIITIRMIIT